jgi:hypothetical protein
MKMLNIYPPVAPGSAPAQVFIDALFGMLDDAINCGIGEPPRVSWTYRDDVFCSPATHERTISIGIFAYAQGAMNALTANHVAIIGSAVEYSRISSSLAKYIDYSVATSSHIVNEVRAKPDIDDFDFLRDLGIVKNDSYPVMACGI